MDMGVETGVDFLVMLLGLMGMTGMMEMNGGVCGMVDG